jgi:hypothetical protein
MINCFNGCGKKGPQQEADQGQQALKATEPAAADGHGLQVRFPHTQALADGHGKGIHAQAHRQQKQLQKTHKILTSIHRTGTIISTMPIVPYYKKVYQYWASLSRRVRELIVKDLVKKDVNSEYSAK